MDLPLLTLAGSPTDALRMASRCLSASCALRRLLRARRPSLVHATGLASTLLAAPATRVARIPLVWHAHDILRRQPRNTLPIRAAAAASRSIVCVSEASRDRLLEFGVAPGKCHLVHDAVPEVRLGALQGPEEGSGEELTVLSAGTITPQKGQHVLVEAARELVRRYPAVQILLAGEVAFEQDRPYREALEASVDRHGLRGNVRFLGFRDDLPDLIGRATVVAHPATDEETLGLVPLEAMAAGRPVVASRIGGIPEVVADGVSGILVAPGNVPELVAAVSTLLDSPEMRERMGSAGRRIAAEKFDARTMRRGLDGVFCAILGVHVFRDVDLDENSTPPP
jgi:glycosyltransferase involved in cell wall biosynthesis